MKTRSAITAPDEQHASAADTPPVENTAPTMTADDAAMIEAARKERASAERARQQAIIMSSVGLKRPTLAHFIAYTTDFDAPAAIGILESAPIERVLQTSRLDGRVPSPRVGFDISDRAEGGAVDWDQIVAVINKETKNGGG